EPPAVAVLLVTRDLSRDPRLGVGQAEDLRVEARHLGVAEQRGDERDVSEGHLAEQQARGGEDDGHGWGVAGWRLQIDRRAPRRERTPGPLRFSIWNPRSAILPAILPGAMLP